MVLTIFKAVVSTQNRNPIVFKTLAPLVGDTAFKSSRHILLSKNARNKLQLFVRLNNDKKIEAYYFVK